MGCPPRIDGPGEAFGEQARHKAGIDGPRDLAG
jgi:hypothetical protein